MAKNIPLKYRAKRRHKYSDEIVYGNLFVRAYGAWIDGVPVDPDTIQKLCGYDSDGNEVYRSYKLKIERLGDYYEYTV